MRRLSCLGALAALGLTSIVVPATADASPAAHLAGKTVITAAKTAREIVDIPRTVHFTYAHGWGSVVGLSIAGPGRIVGLALVSTERPQQAGFVEMRMRSCFRRACTQPAPETPDEVLEVDWGGPPPDPGAHEAPDGFTLPAGRYQLSVFTDGAPVRMTWRIAGLSGRTTLEPLLPQRSSEVSPPEHAIGGTPASPASTQASGTGSIATDVGILAMAHFVKGSAHVSSDSWWCIYDGNGPPGGVMTEGCPGGGGVGFGGIYVTQSYGGMGWGVFVSIGTGTAGDYFQGVDDTGAQVITDAHDTLMWADAGIPTQHH